MIRRSIILTVSEVTVLCGLFGFSGNSLNDDILCECASGAAERGPQAWGVVIVKGGRLSTHYGTGTINPEDDLLKVCQGADKVLGHCRLPTQGPISFKQPASCGHGFLAHNGNIYNLDRYSYEVKTSCDTEVLAAHVESIAPKDEKHFAAICRELHGTTPFAASLITGTEFFIARQWHPIFLQFACASNVYFSSKQIPGSFMMQESVRIG